MGIPAVIAHGGAGPGPERGENVKIAVRVASKMDHMYHSNHL